MAAHLHLVDPRADGCAWRAGVPIRVGLAEGHPAVRHCLQLLLDADEDICVVAEAADAERAAQQAHRHRADVLVLNLPRLDRDRVAVIAHLQQVAQSRIVVMTMDSKPSLAWEALAAGVSGLVLRDRADSELPSAIRYAAAGFEYITPRLAGVPNHRRSVRGARLRPGVRSTWLQTR